ncbi:uncharacterized protein SPPG_03159 [Spizellomyces punctatus DAOM BR117]|uniref:Ribosomal RNA methyltransferase FtsJ domain-containing protein n=1 Tax=Spizellomyces punctatus (strain DAOM BR117) TaxID=645134 RepID=A0A0L0HJP9_SPIPD|nr:uncharacterized protein SPPG_03159 [Spizellomyces punctatus DAOM BR117]KND01347.1 hypothetical protein SPPG_03159 [Spizellomyces punctatus DAOM BR117]|eukprot:XP_016609386.1 hypothetical protein SPPG_03159 [Spizellomyces punctatus DAOM BR117]
MARYVPPHRRNAAAVAIPHVAPSVEPPQLNKVIPADLDFFHLHLYNSSLLLRSLHNLKDEFENDPNVERMFVSNRAHSANVTAATTPKESGPAVSSSHFANQFRGAMDEVDKQTGGKLRGCVKHFLDLGSAPGGFSRWILENNDDAVGMGVTLPLEMGGLPMVMEGVLGEMDRYTSLYRDVTEKPESIRFVSPCHTDPPDVGCDLVIAGSIYRDHSTADPSRLGPPPLQVRSRQLLSFSQLLAALTNLGENGTLIIVSNMKPQLQNLEILCFLNDFFTELVPVKPKGVHTIRSSYYLVALGYNREKSLRMNVLGRLSRALERIQAADEEKGVQGLLVLEGTEASIVEKWGDYALKFYQPLWESQLHALERKLARLRSERNGAGRWKNARGSGSGEGDNAWRFSRERPKQQWG